MEHKSDTTVADVYGKDKIIKDQALPKPKKKKGAMHLIRVALYMIRRKSDKSKASIPVHVAYKGPWRKFLASMRPLHVQSSLRAAPMIEHSEEVFTPPMSPAPARSVASHAPSCSEDGMSSKYASALNLQELDTGDSDEDEEDENDDNIGGDEMIDVKAEEFINQFYEQMRIQNVLNK